MNSETEVKPGEEVYSGKEDDSTALPPATGIEARGIQFPTGKQCPAVADYSTVTKDLLLTDLSSQANRTSSLILENSGVDDHARSRLKPEPMSTDSKLQAMARKLWCD